MPRGIPKAKDQEPVKKPVEKTKEQKVYELYVQGVRLVDIAEQFEMEPSEVFEIVRK